MPPWIIFRGEGHITLEEVEYLDSLNIGWSFQRNAWADGPYCRKHLRAFISVLGAHGLGSQNHLLFLDDLAAQKNPAFNKIALDGNVLPFPIPGGLIYYSHTPLIFYYRDDRFAPASRLPCRCANETNYGKFIQDRGGTQLRRMEESPNDRSVVGHEPTKAHGSMAGRGLEAPDRTSAHSHPSLRTHSSRQA